MEREVFLRTVIEMAPSSWWAILTCIDTETRISPHIYLSHCSTLVVHSLCQNASWPTCVSHSWLRNQQTHWFLQMSETPSVPHFLELNFIPVLHELRVYVVVDVCEMDVWLFPPQAVLGTGVQTVAVNKDFICWSNHFIFCKSWPTR